MSPLVPVILLLALGIAAAIGSRAVGLSPIVGCLALGAGLGALGIDMVADSETFATLAEPGVVFLLFEICLLLSLSHVRLKARDIFGFGLVQLIACTVAVGAAALAFSLTATSILLFQDVAAIFLLVVVAALGGGQACGPAIGSALVKAAAAFGIAVLLAKMVIGPLFDLMALGLNEEVFTAMALLVALAAGWAAGDDVSALLLPFILHRFDAATIRQVTGSTALFDLMDTGHLMRRGKAY